MPPEATVDSLRLACTLTAETDVLFQNDDATDLKPNYFTTGVHRKVKQGVRIPSFFIRQ
jgi:hypothetical protein